MKNKLVIIGAAGLIILGGAVGAFANANQVEDEKKNVISMEEAEKIAKTEVEGNIENIELEEDDGRLIYDVEFEDGKKLDDAEVEIEAKTGKVLEIDQDDKEVKNNKVNTGVKNNQETKIEKDDDQDDKKVTTKETKKRITKQEAMNIATKNTPGKVTEVEYDDGYYEIEVKTNNAEVEYKIRATDGKIVKKETDRKDDRQSKKKISKQDAINIATKNAPGKVTEVDYDDDGYYEIEVKSGNTEVEFKISAYDGEIIEKDVERDDD
ncbi:MAG TPA: PepSY domain-containing protein [Bacillaceae bacterium]|nr:PepSY domain-containing protein [Bacillaceae bacterium]